PGVARTPRRLVVMSFPWIMCGLALGAGILLVVSGFQQRPIRPAAQPSFSFQDLPADAAKRGVQAAVCSTLVLAFTGRPIPALAAAMFGWFASELLGGSRAVDVVVARTEAIATWTEMLRDTIGAAHGLESAIAATAPVAPGPIHDEIGALAARL